MAGLYLSIPHDSGLKALKNILEKGKKQNISIADFIKMTEFVLRNNYFEFNGKVKQQILGKAIGTKCAPTYACIYMDEFENEFLSLRSDKPLVWLSYIDVFFIWTHGEKELHIHMRDLNNHQPNIKLHILSVKIESLFLIWTFSYQGVSLPQIYISSLQIATNIYILRHPTQVILSALLNIVKYLE